MVHQYKLGGYNIVLDVCSGSVHVVDEVAYDIIAMFETADRSAILAAMAEKYADREDISQEDIAGKSVVLEDMTGMNVDDARQRLAKQLREGGDIDALMKEYSNDYQQDGQNAYTFTYGEMVKEFEDTAFSMEVGQVSDPVKSTYGYHVMYFVESELGWVLYCRDGIRAEKNEAYLAKLQEANPIEVDYKHISVVATPLT